MPLRGLCICTLDELKTVGEFRRIFVHAAWALAGASAEIAALADVDIRTVQRASKQVDRQVQVIRQVAGDRRFRALPKGNLFLQPSWRDFAARRSIPVPGDPDHHGA